MKATIDGSASTYVQKPAFRGVGVTDNCHRLSVLKSVPDMQCRHQPGNMSVTLEVVHSQHIASRCVIQKDSNRDLRRSSMKRMHVLGLASSLYGPE